MNWIESEKQKSYGYMGSDKSKRKNLRQLPQRGKTNIKRDVVRKGMLPGKRVSVTGQVYWETRKNRTDAKGSKI